MNENWELMHRLADGDVQGEEKARAQELAASDPVCARELAWATYIKSTLRENCRPVQHEDGWKACVKRLDEIDKTKTTETLVGRYSWALCGIFLVGLLVAGIGNRTMAPSRISASQIANVLSPVSESPGRVVDIESATSLNLSKFQVTSETGGVLDGGRPYARYGLRDRLGLGGLALVVVRGRGTVEAFQQKTRVQGVMAGTINERNAVVWNFQGYTCMLIGERTKDELADLVIDLVSR